MATSVLRKAVAVWLLLALCGSVSAAGKVITERDWLFAKQIDLYTYLLNFTQISDPSRDKLQEGFHRFAFEYWLLCRTNPASASPWWRYHLRRMLHREASNQRYFNDPAALLPFFKDGKPVPSQIVAPVTGLDLVGLSERDYIGLVKGFQSTFFDATNAFPVNPIPPASEMAGEKTEEHLELANRLSRKTWPLTGRQHLPVEYRDDPLGAFRLLSVTGRVYYLPAFLIMCESDADRIGDFPRKLLAELVADTPEAIELRSRLTDAQRKCITAFFDDWFRGNDKVYASLKKLGKLLAPETGK